MLIQQQCDKLLKLIVLHRMMWIRGLTMLLQPLQNLQAFWLSAEGQVTISALDIMQPRPA